MNIVQSFKFLNNSSTPILYGWIKHTYKHLMPFNHDKFIYFFTIEKK